MAINIVSYVKFAVCVFIIFCTEKHIFALKVKQIVSNIHVIEHARHRREIEVHKDHTYYQSTMFTADNIDEFWVDLKNVTGHPTLSDGHRKAVTVKLSFMFPFYGHLVDNVTIAIGGFLYMSPVLHQYLTATQYIAPLMANFDTRLGNTSEILYISTDKTFVVEWRDVHLQDQNDAGPFRFQVILHVNGSVTFVYKELPLKVAEISSSEAIVKVGLSDAYYIGTPRADGTKRITIYEYNRIVLNTTFVEEGTVAMITPSPTCNQFQDCENCVTSKTNFNCTWCDSIQKCSDGMDWYRQEWLESSCNLSNEENGTCSLTTTTGSTTLNVSATTTTQDVDINSTSTPHTHDISANTSPTTRDNSAATTTTREGHIISTMTPHTHDFSTTTSPTARDNSATSTTREGDINATMTLHTADISVTTTQTTRDILSTTTSPKRFVFFTTNQTISGGNQNITRQTMFELKCLLSWLLVWLSSLRC